MSIFIIFYGYKLNSDFHDSDYYEKYVKTHKNRVLIYSVFIIN
jgi:hypothetical protein